VHTGVDGSFVKEVEGQLAPGRSALFLVLKDGSADAIAAALRPYRGELIQTTLPSDLEEELRSSLDQKD
jgi:uncharacterized membrane protein